MKKSLLIIILTIITITICTGCNKQGKELNLKETSTVTFNDLTIEIPKDFEKDALNNEDKSNFKLYYGDTYCSLYLNTYDSIYSENEKQEEIKQWINIIMESENENVPFKNINGHDWGYGEKNTNDIYYSSIYKGKKYTVNYKYEEEYSNGICEEAFEIILNSLNFK